jgi:hypothetical protein
MNDKNAVGNNGEVDLAAIMIFNAFTSATVLAKLLQDISRHMCQHLGSELSAYGTSCWNSSSV